MNPTVRFRNFLRQPVFVATRRALTIAVLLGASASVQAADGDLDTTFGTSGKNSISFGASDLAYGSYLQSDGKMLVVGGARPASTEDFGVARFNANGSVDATFGTNGAYSLEITASAADRATGVGVQSDGKIIVGGYTRFASGNDNFAVIRLTSAGVLDTTFGTSGIVQIDFAGRTDRAMCLQVLSDDRIVIAGWGSTDGLNLNFALARLTSSGALDTTFDTDGKAMIDVGNSQDTTNAMAVQSDGKILIGGVAANSGGNFQLALLRFNTNGSLDTSFDTDGVVSWNFSGSGGDYIYGLAVQSDGKIVAVGNTTGSQNAFIARFTSTGALDTSFNTTGYNIVDLGSTSDIFQAVVAQPDGKFVVGGVYTNGSSNDSALARFTSTGALDSTFGSSGLKLISLGGSSDRILGLGLQSSGAIVASLQTAESSGTDNFGVARFLNAAATPPSISSIVRADGASATVSASATSVSYTVTFNESVTGVDTSDFSVAATGTADGSIASISGSGTTYTVVVNTLSGDGTLRLDLNSSGTGIKNGTNTSIASGYTAGSTYTLDHTVPNAPSAPDMTSGTDTGSSSSDNITNDNTPTFTGTAESGSTVRLYDTDGTTELGSGTATGGNWNITVSTLSAGSHTLTAKATDAAGNTSATSSSLSVTIDTTAPTGLGVSATTTTTLSASSTATIATLSATDGQAITFSLAVGNGTNDADNGSFTISGTSLKVGGASLSAGTYKIYVAATDTAGNVANQAFTLTIVDAPSVSSIVRAGGASATVTASATSVGYTVTFSESVTGVDSSDFSVTATGTADGSIASISGSGATYTVTVNGIGGDGTLRLDLKSGGTGIKNGGNVEIASGYTSGSTYTLDHTAPNAPSTPDMTSASDSGTSSSDNITSDETPTFTGTAESGSTVRLYDTDGTTELGSGTATGGNWSITSSTLSAGSHTVIAKATDAAGNTSSASSGLALTIDPAAPTVSSVSVPSSGSYRAGQTLTFTVNANEAVTIDTGGGMPRVALTMGSSTVYATYASGSGGTALAFTYAIQPGDTDADGIAVGSLQSNGGMLRDTAGNSLNLTLNSVGATTNVLVDTTAPTVNSVSVPSNGTYYSNQNLDFTVNFSEAVTVNTGGGTPRIALTLDTGGTVYATYASGSSTSALVFRYTVADGVQDANGVTVGALGANGATLRDLAGNDATLTLNSVGSTAAVNVDGTQPRVLAVTATTPNGNYNAGDAISITVSFTKSVTVDTTGGTPTLALDSGGSANYASGSGSATLVFTYAIGAGENSADLDYTSTSALALSDGTIKDSGGSNLDAVLTLAAPGANGSLGANKTIVVDTTAPTITFSNLAFSGDTGASSTDFITNTAPQTITATLSGAPTGTDVVYGSLDNGGSWTDLTSKVSGTTLTWNSVTLTASSTLRLKVTDNAGNDGTVASQDYTLDTTAPTVTAANITISGASGGGGAFKTGDTVTASWNNTAGGDNNPDAISSVTVNFSEFGGGAAVVASNSAGTWSATYTVTAGAIDATGRNIAITATDSAGNVTTTADDANATVDNQAPVVTAAKISLSGASGTGGAFKIGDTITATWDSTAAGDNNSDIASAAVDFSAFGGGAAVAATDSSGTWTATYTLVAGAIDAANLNVSVTATDNAGIATTTADTTNATADNQAPALTDAHISISGATGTNGVFKIGDTVTATWNNTAAGDNNADTIAGVTVNFTAFGGGATVAATNSSGTWTATYVIAAGAIDAANLNVFVSATDNAGNATTTADTTNAAVDSVAPAAPSAPDLDPASDSGASNTDNITTDTTPTFTGTATDGNTVTLLEGTTVLGTATATNGNWSITTAALTAGAHTVKARTSDASGNVSADSATLTVTIDTSTPTLQTIARHAPATVNTDASSVTWRVTFDDGVSGVDSSDFTLTAVQGTPAGTIASATAVSSSVYDIVVNALSGQGMLRLDLKASGTGIADLAGTALVNGGYTTGDFYVVGVTNVFDTVSLATGVARSVSHVAANRVAQRFTTASAAPLSLTTVTAAVGAVTGAPTPVVTIHADNAGSVGALVTTLTNATSLQANALNVWTSTRLLSANTTYWVVFADSSLAGDYEIEETAATTGGVGSWIGDADYVYLHGMNASTGPQTGALQIALGATNLPAITSELTASGTYGATFSYTVTATNTPTSYAASGLPGGLTLNASTGVISGTPTQAGRFDVALTGTNESGTGVSSTLAVTINPAILRVDAIAATRSYGEENPLLDVNYSGFVNGDTPASLPSPAAATTSATATSPVGTYVITASGGSSPNYSFTTFDAVLTIVKASQTIAFTPVGGLIIGDTATLAAISTSTLPVTFSVVSGPATISGTTLTTNGVGNVIVRAAQIGNANYSAALDVDQTIAVALAPARVTTPTEIPVPPTGGTAQLVVTEPNANVTYQWQRNGADVPNGTGASLVINDAQPPVAGLYTYTATVSGGSGGTSEPVIVGISTEEKVVGSGGEIGTDIQHPNGNTYDQLLLEGAGVTFTANPGQVTRISFLDMSFDIVQVEFAGAGTLSLVMDNASNPAPAQNYNQPGINYVRGHAGLVITGANETTNVSVFSVGRVTAVNQGLFIDTVNYDGIADLAFIAIQSTDGKFGGVRTGNVNFFATQGFTGVYAPGVTLSGPLNIGEVTAFDSATPVIVVGAVAEARITGGDLAQPNGATVKVSGIARLRFVDGTTSHGARLPAQANQGVLTKDGVDVTGQIVVNP